jgi:hypothetical protein
MTSYSQRCRDAQTILQARWPSRAATLPKHLQELIATIMVEYAMQCELGILRERESKQ